MYEHAYHMDYGAAAAKYVDSFMQNVNWDEVNRRVEAVVVESVGRLWAIQSLRASERSNGVRGRAIGTDNTFPHSERRL